MSQHARSRDGRPTGIDEHPLALIFTVADYGLEALMHTFAPNHGKQPPTRIGGSPPLLNRLRNCMMTLLPVPLNESVRATGSLGYVNDCTLSGGPLLWVMQDTGFAVRREVAPLV